MRRKKSPPLHKTAVARRPTRDPTSVPGLAPKPKSTGSSRVTDKVTEPELHRARATRSVAIDHEAKTEIHTIDFDALGSTPAASTERAIPLFIKSGEDE